MEISGREAAPIGDQVDHVIEYKRIRVLPDGRVSRRSAAIYLGVAEKTLAMWAMKGKGPRVRKVGGRCFYFLSDLDACVR